MKKKILAPLSMALMIGGSLASLQAADSAGISGSVKTLGEVAVNKPNTPANVKVTANGSEATVTWSDKSDNEDGFRIWKRDPNTGKWTSAKVAAGATSYTFNNISAGKTYKFAVSAYNGVGWNTSASVAFGANKPNTPANIKITANGSKATVTWSDRSDNEDGFRVWIKWPVSGWHAVKVGANTTSYTYSVESGKSYKFAVSAYNGIGWNTSASVAFGVNKPNTPANVKVTANGSEATVTWSDKSDNEDGFRIWKRDPNTGKWTSAKVAAGATSYTFNNISAGKTYKFAVSAYNGVGWNTSASVAFGANKPNTPANIKITANGSKATVTWSDRSDNEDGFRVWIKWPVSGWHAVKVGANTTSYTYSVESGKSYKFAVSAYNGIGWNTSASVAADIH